MAKKEISNKQTKKDAQNSKAETASMSIKQSKEHKNNLNDEQEEKIDNESKILEMEKKLAKEQQQNKELYDKYLRINAEFENFKKRKEKEKEDFCKYAAERPLKAILPVIDHFELAIESS